jgi:hypothetical protein
MRPGWLGPLVLLLAAGIGRAQSPVPPQAAPALPAPSYFADYPGVPATIGGGIPFVSDDASTIAVQPGKRPLPLPTQHGTADPYLTWGSAEYLFWWVKPGPAPPPLLTTGPVSANTGALGAPGTQVVFGDSAFHYGTFAGGQYRVGSWCELCPTWGFEVSGFNLEQRSVSFNKVSDGTGTPPLIRPFFNVLTDSQDFDRVTFPGEFAGGAVVSSGSHFWGLEVDVVKNALPWAALGQEHHSWGDIHFEVQAGFRYLDLHEALNIQQISELLPGGGANFIGFQIGPPATIVVADRFDTRNQFYGGEVTGHLQYC